MRPSECAANSCDEETALPSLDRTRPARAAASTSFVGAALGLERAGELAGAAARAGGAARAAGRGFGAGATFSLPVFATRSAPSRFLLAAASSAAAPPGVV